MILEALAAASMVCAAVPCSLFLANVRLYRRPPLAAAISPLPAVSLLIPARNEEAGIAAAVHAALQSRDVTLEVLVMDDASTDRTASIVQALADRDPRVRLLAAPRLPAGWNGKQHACHALAHAARYDIFCFVDADVRLAPDAVSRMAAFLDASHAALVSGFPRQLTGTTLEWLLLPLIHFVLLGLLPFAGMRRSTAPSFAAGCGQFLMVRRPAYFASGGHAGIRETMHDGLRLPRLLREHGFPTDLADLTDLATCRMYRSAPEVWSGLAKNATEGLAAPARIAPITFLLFIGEVLPYLLLVWLLIQPHQATLPILVMVGVALWAASFPRFVAAIRYRQRLRSALLHPVGIVVLLCLQWSALVRKLRGRSVSWRSRSYDPQPPTPTEAV